MGHKRFMPGTVRKTKMDETGEKMIKREVSVKKEEDIDDESCVNVFGEDSVIVKNEEKEFEEENLLVNPDLLKEEKDLIEINKQEVENDAEKDVKEVAEELTREERYEKLCELLKTSKFYSDFLVKKLTEQDEASKNVKSEKLKDRRSVEENSNKGKRKGLARNAKPQKKAKIEGRYFDGEPIPVEQPLLLSGGIMRDYQIEGYQWMANLWEQGINGILADEMGLGKTIQTIALFSHLVEMGVEGPFLVVAPLSTICNWQKEFNRFAPKLPVVRYHGTSKQREELRAAHLTEEVDIKGVFSEKRTTKNIFITSYEICMNDRYHFHKVLWKYIVVDEGHRLKNTNCRLIKELRLYTSANRLLLTGTPLQNNLDELWSLLNFLMPEIFDDLRVFRAWFDAREIHHNESESGRIMQQEQQQNILSTLHQILTPFLLRRVKADVDLKIPPKKEVLVYCPLTEKQRDLYESAVNRTLGSLLGSKKKDEVELTFDSTKKGGWMAKIGHTGNLNEEKKPRSAALNVDYKVFLDTNAEGDRAFEKYCDNMRSLKEQNGYKEQTGYSLGSSYKAEGRSIDADINFSVKSRLMDLCKTCNHPYLIEYPLSEDGNFYQADEDMIDICGKLKVLDQMLAELRERGHKVLIFSQMTKLLDILSDYLHYRDINFSRLDGSMHFEDRQDNIDRFNNIPEQGVFLLSTRAGGLGINLTAADTVIIYDSDWNPQQDLQAQDRAHRIGQTKPVMVYRLVTANTIDEKIVERAAAKRKLEKMIIHRNKFKSQDTDGLKTTMQALTPQELMELLESKDHAGVVDRKDQPVFTKEEMDLLLDRSDLTWEKINKEQKPINKKKQGEDFGLTSLAVDDKSNENGTIKTSANHFKVIDTDGQPQGLPSVQED